MIYIIGIKTINTRRSKEEAEEAEADKPQFSVMENISDCYRPAALPDIYLFRRRYAPGVALLLVVVW